MKNKKILVIAAHPDDELLGCGGSLAKLSKQGCNIFALFFTDGVSSRVKNNKIEISKRQKNSLKSLKILDGKYYFSDQYYEVVIKKFRPSVIFTHSNVDLNIDHEIISRAVVTATRPKPKFCVKKIFLFETLSSTEWNFNLKKKSFNPNFFIDISKTIDIKIRSAKAYKGEITSWPHPRSLNGIKNLAKYRGQSVGVKYAEAFYLLREIS